MKRFILAALFSFLLALPAPTLTLAAPKAELWSDWQAHDPESSLQVDHTPWDAFLATYLSLGPIGVNRLAYAAVTNKDKAALDAYIKELAATPVSRLSKEEQLPYWINLYNALTVQVVLDHFPVASITDIDISPGLFSFGPWDKKLLRIEGREVSLNDIEHRILRPIWKDPRLHYAVNCASLGCPNLREKAFTRENTEEMLDLGAWEYVNHPRGVAVKKGKLVVSSIYHWFKEDFGGTGQGVVDHLRRHASPQWQDRLEKFDGYDDHHYDWTINEAE
jgi:hypothetical protein